jgi:phage terminase small subunit
MGEQKAFIEHYLECWNATRAAEKADYGGDDNALAAAGSRLLRNVKIRRRIQERLNTKAMTADEVLARLSEHARGNIGDLLDPSGMVLDLGAAKEAGLTRLIKSISWTKSGVRVEMYDAQAALALLGKAHALFTDKHETTIGGSLKVEYVNDWRGPADDGDD